MVTYDCDQSRTRYEHVINDVGWLSANSVVDAFCDKDESAKFFATQGNVPGLEHEAFSLFVSDVRDDDIESVPGFANPLDSIEICFLDDAIALERQGNVRASLATIYRRVDELMREGMLKDLDDEITSVRAEDIGTDVLLGLLTATLPAKRKLPSRPQLFRNTLRLLKTRGDFEPGVLDGLE